MTACRCGYVGEGPHPCHARGYTCRAPARLQLYAPRYVSLAGVQAKVEVSETWACDACWEAFMVLLRAPSPLSAAPRAILGAWPGDESDEQIAAVLRDGPSASETTPATHFGGVGRFLAADSARLTREARASVALDGETHCVDEPSLRGEGTSGTDNSSKEGE